MPFKCNDNQKGLLRDYEKMLPCRARQHDCPSKLNITLPSNKCTLFGDWLPGNAGTPHEAVELGDHPLRDR